MTLLRRIHEYLVLNRPAWTLAGLAIVIGVSLAYAPEFKLDASADSLMLEDDDDLRYFRMINKRYQSEPFVAVTYRPEAGIFEEQTLKRIKALRDELEALDGISKVLSILDVPLLNSPRVPLDELAKNIRTLETPGVDYEAARREFMGSPLYRELLVSENGDTTVLLAYLEPDRRYQTLFIQRSDLYDLKHSKLLSPEQARQLKRVEHEFREYQAEHAATERGRIAEIRGVLDRHRTHSEIFLGGVPMIVADMISFIRNDLFNFGAAIVIFMVLVLTAIFRQLRWVILPMLCCGLSALATVGLLGFLDWRVTVVSANFLALLLIITMSLTIHLIVRYRENQMRNPAEGKVSLIRGTMRFMFEPCFYAILTTITAFISLLVSGIRPVIDFGQIMTVGISLAFVLTFLLFPCILMVMPRGSSRPENDFTTKLTMGFAGFTQKHHYAVTVAASVVVVLSIAGITRLEVENRFIDYFGDDTEIHQGMLLIDRKLGGTTPLDLVLTAPQAGSAEDDPVPDEGGDLLDDYFTEELEETGKSTGYWLSPLRFEQVKRIHDYFESQREVGKVLSLATLIKLAEQLNEDKPLSDLEAALLPKLVPENIRAILIDPYLSDDGNELRFNMRVIDSDEQLRRKELLERVQSDIKQLSRPDTQFRFTGMLVLYNNMLQSLYNSQILTLGMVFLAITLMFVVLFRSVKLAIIAIVPNLIAAGLVLGFMGWSGLPLNIMTITIAAISIGIAVDNTIHYVVRFKREFPRDGNYFAAVMRCHGSIGKAIYYTSSIIIIGFSILALSNFVPSVHFGLLTGLAMFVALLASLTLLPSLLIIFRPLGTAAQSVSAARPT